MYFFIEQQCYFPQLSRKQNKSRPYLGFCLRSSALVIMRGSEAAHPHLHSTRAAVVEQDS